MSTAGILRWLRGLTVVDDEDAGARPPLHLLRFTTHAELNENESAVDLVQNALAELVVVDVMSPGRPRCVPQRALSLPSYSKTRSDDISRTPPSLGVAEV